MTEAIKTKHQLELQQIEATLFRLAERRRELQMILATLDAVEQAVSSAPEAAQGA